MRPRPATRPRRPRRPASRRRRRRPGPCWPSAAWSRRRWPARSWRHDGSGPRLVEAPDPDADPLLEALDASIEDLEGEGDPRSAVIAAYARLLDGFERCGLGRRPAETPLEHLRRGLAALPLRPEPAERLTDLFLEARFSPHPIGPAERDEAHAALLTARRDLAVTATAG